MVSEYTIHKHGTVESIIILSDTYPLFENISEIQNLNVLFIILIQLLSL